VRDDIDFFFVNVILVVAVKYDDPEVDSSIDSCEDSQLEIVVEVYSDNDMPVVAPFKFAPPFNPANSCSHWQRGTEQGGLQYFYFSIRWASFVSVIVHERIHSSRIQNNKRSNAQDTRTTEVKVGSICSSKNAYHESHWVSI
jgi:hypothetical protein